jgi:type IV pilus assembly protein PilC
MANSLSAKGNQEKAIPLLLSGVRTVLGYTIPQKALMLFFDSLAIQLNVGRPIPESLTAASFNSGDKELQQICSIVAPQLSRGASLCSSLRPYTSRFPEIVLCVLEVGEMSGGIGESAQRLSDTFRQSVNAERDIKTNAYSHPKALLGLCLIQAIVLFTTTDKNQPLIYSAIDIALKIVAFAFEIVFAFFAGRVILKGLYRWHALRLIVDTIKLALPGLGIVSRNLSAARWARSFATLWRAGVNISTGLEVSSRSALNAHYERELLFAAKQTRLGQPLSVCLARTQLLPPHLLQIIRVCDETGKLDDQLLRTAYEMERDALDRSIREMNRIVTYTYILFVAIAFIIVLSTLTSA